MANSSKLNPTDARETRPFVFVNMAMSADAKIATTNRLVSSFGSRRDARHLHELRATADAVMCGARTVDLNPVSLGPGGQSFVDRRISHGLAPYNLRVIVSRTGSVSPEAEIFRHRFSPLILLTTNAAGEARRNRLAPLVDAVRVGGETEIRWPETLRWLRQEWGVKRLLCEGGGALNAALFNAGLVDELHITLCPMVLGGRKAPTIASGLELRELAQATKLRIESMKRVGSELFLVLTRTDFAAQSLPPP